MRLPESKSDRKLSPFTKILVLAGPFQHLFLLGIPESFETLEPFETLESFEAPEPSSTSPRSWPGDCCGLCGGARGSGEVTLSNPDDEDSLQQLLSMSHDAEYIVVASKTHARRSSERTMNID